MNGFLMLPAHRIFIMRVRSDDLKAAHIQKGDFISCEHTDRLEQGQFGVLQTPYGILLRFFFQTEDYVRLEPVSCDFATLYLSSREVQVIGRPLLLHRDLRDMRKSEVSESDT